MNNLTSRSRIAIRWTTNPGNLGYDGPKTDWRNGQAAEITSPRLALEFPAKLAQKIGQGTYHAISYKHNGVEVTREQLEACVWSAIYDREVR